MYKKFPDAKILKINLTKKEIVKEKLPGDIYRLDPGGSALGMYLAMQDIKPKIDPLSEENVLVFSVSALTGLPISGISRVNVTGKSPLTGTIGDSQAGGFFPVHLKASGYDAVVINGKSENPIYLYIDGDKIELKDAKNIWGKVTGESEEIIRKELGREDVEISQIGPVEELMYGANRLRQFPNTAIRIPKRHAQKQRIQNESHNDLHDIGAIHIAIHGIHFLGLCISPPV